MIIAKEKNIPFHKEDIYEALTVNFNANVDTDEFRNNFNLLINTLNINTSALASSMAFSLSLISKIKSGSRTPFDIAEFANSTTKYVVNVYQNSSYKEKIAKLLNCQIEDIEDNINYYNKLVNFLLATSQTSNNSIENFLNNLDKFDLDEYIKSIHFDELKAPSVPFYIPTKKNYFGIEQMKKGELDFFKATILSKSSEPIFMCNDMPMEEMAKDIEFAKKWMMAIAMSLKKGLHLNIIHNVNRPLKEMMIGLEGWIPIYMTGQVSPYYLKNFKDNTYYHLDYVSGVVALNGESIKSNHATAKSTLFVDKQNLEYYKNKSKGLLEIASPLMEIYKSENKKQFINFMVSDSETLGKRRRILQSLPIHTLSKELLLKILHENKVPENDIKNILNMYEKEKETIKNILKQNIFIDEFEEVSKEEFDKEEQQLFLATSFYEKKILYNYETYLEHLELTKKYEINNPNYKIVMKKNQAFKNIQIFIHSKKLVVISKNTSPAIHFVIHHPNLVSAIENFVPPIVD